MLDILFLCGHNSPYGMAHLEPILDSRFNVRAVVIAKEERWTRFRESLLGKRYLRQRLDVAQRLKSLIRSLLRLLLLRREPISAEVRLQRVLRDRGIPCIEVFDVNDASVIDMLAGFNPDLLISAAYPQILSKELLSLPRLGGVNFHPSLLPRYRGAHPHFWSIAKGEKVSGLSAHFMTDKIDDGDIVAQVEYPIAHLEYPELYAFMVKKTPDIVKKVEDFFYLGDRDPVPQDTSDVSCYRNDREIHARIFWSLMTADAIRNLARTRKGFCFFHGVKVKLLTAGIEQTNRNLTNGVMVECGTIIDFIDGRLVIKASDGCVHVAQMEVKGKLYSAEKWFMKNRVELGDKFY